jgi:hypothetical protein
METMKENTTDTITGTQPCLLTRHLDADTLPVLLARVHNTVEPVFNRDTGGLPRPSQILPQNNPVCTK